MASQQQQQKQHSSRYPSLLITVQRETEERTVAEAHSKPRLHRSKDHYRSVSFQPKTVYYNSNHRHHQQQQYFARPTQTPARRQQQQYYNNYDCIHYHYEHQPLRPLMEIKDDRFSLHHDLHNNHDYDDDNGDNDIAYRKYNQKEPKQRGQYRNRKAELDWDHAFDLDLIDLYTTHADIDSHSLTSTISSSDHSFSSM